MNNNIIYIIGLSGCGKSTISKCLSRKLNYSFYDTDSVIEETENMTINNIFSEYGEPHFRKLETATLEKMSKKENAVIATGGGIVLSEKNRVILKEVGIIIFIDRSPLNITENINISVRPLLKDSKDKIFKLHEERYELYKSLADITKSFNEWLTIEETTNILLEALEGKIK